MSKRIWQHPEIPADEKTISWRSLGQLEDTPEFRTWMEREFPQGVAEMENEQDAEVSRRSFLKLMGASTALAGFGLAACRRPESYIVPYNTAPEWVIPGKATFYASSMPRPGGAVPLVVTTFEGRPTKVAPNALHPDVSGTDAFTQASVLDLYSPSRSRTVLHNGQASTRAAFEKVLSEIAKDKSAKVGFVFGHDDSPTRARLVGELGKTFSAAKFYAYEALEGSNGLPDGTRLIADFDKADVILSLDSDFLCLDGQGKTTAFFNRRKPEGAAYDKKADPKSMNRLYQVESVYSMTGGMADHRLRVKPSMVVQVAAKVAEIVGAQAGGSITGNFDAKQLAWITAMANDLKAAGGKAVVLAGSRQPTAVHQIALAINKKLATTALTAVKADAGKLGNIEDLVTDLNANAIDTLVLLTPANPVYDAPADSGFIPAMAKAKTVIHLGTRTDATAHTATWHVPASHYLESWGDARSLTGVYTIVQPLILPLYPACAAELEILAAFLSDDGKLVTGETADGKPTPAYHAVRATFEVLGGKGDEPWKKLLRDGYHAGSKYETSDLPAVSASIAAGPASSDLEVIFSTDGSVYDGRWIDNGWLQEAPDPISKISWDNAALIAPETAKDLGIYDLVIEPEPVGKTFGVEGKYARKGPDAEGPQRTSPMIKLKVNGAELVLPVMIAFGQAENTIIIPLGYGQGFDKEDKFGRNANGKTPAEHVGLVGVNSGFNAYPLRTAATKYFATGVSIEKVEGRYPMALVQEHFAMYGRALAREISTMTDENHHVGDFATQLEHVAKQGNDAHAPPNVSLYKQEGAVDPKTGERTPHLSDKLHQWGMTIDLSSCMGCNACLVACQAENNIPIVGKEQVMKGREMHWIRMDRYFAVQEIDEADKDKVDLGNPTMIPQPVACQHCESAPCETVCPVNATIHDEEGLNVMAYNRCIGTRYCANNCPYKARRFNFFDYNKRNPLIAHNLYKGPFGEKQQGTAPHLQRNPNVSVRMRGVMEKCTYCVQRLKDAKIRQKRGQKQEMLLTGEKSTDQTVSNETLRIPVDSVKVACQEACPAGGIEFGNLLDGDKSVMYRAKHGERSYDLLNYIGTRPRTSYLARVKNPNVLMPDAKYVGKATVHMH